MMYSVKGTITKVGSVQEFSSGFQKKLFVLKVEQPYGAEWGISLIKDDVDKLSSTDEGKEAEVKFEIRGRDWEGRNFIDLECRELAFLQKEVVRGSKKAGEKVDAMTIKSPQQLPETVQDDDLPF
jgi:hypothetical protein